MFNIDVLSHRYGIDKRLQVYLMRETLLLAAPQPSMLMRNDSRVLLRRLIAAAAERAGAAGD